MFYFVALQVMSFQHTIGTCTIHVHCTMRVTSVLHPTSRNALPLCASQAPGTSAALLQELLVKLATSQDASLAPSRAAAATLLSPTDPGAAGASAPQRAVATGTVGFQLPPRKVGSLGPLGEFLLGLWQEEEAIETALLARGQKLPTPM